MGPPDSGSDEEPTKYAKVKVEKTKEGTVTDISLPAEPTFNFVQLIIFALAAIGAIVGPFLTLAHMPSNFPTWETMTVVLGQEAILVVLILGIFFLARGGARSH